MWDSKRIFIFVAGFFLFGLTLSCAHETIEPQANAAPPPPPEPVRVEEPVETPPPAVPAVKAPDKPAPPVNQTWRVKNGKIAGKWPKALMIGKFKNKKLPGFTEDVCYNFGEFSVVETKSTGEMGSAEILLRYPDEKFKSLCHTEFKGKYANLRIIEGHFAGIAGDYVVIDGDEKLEGTSDFQLFDIKTGKEAFKGQRNFDEELSVTKNGDVTSIEFFAKVKVPCELASDGAPCWKKVLEQNKVLKPTPMPDCKSAFEKAKISLFELALVTIKARVPNIINGKLEFTGGKATCAPAPP